MDLNEFMAQSNARARRGRRLAREMFGAAILILFATGFFFVAAPNGPSAMYVSGPVALALAVPAIGILGLAVGLLWMIRILRADPEPKGKGWRYRDF